MAYFALESLNRGNWRALIFWTGLPGAIAWIVAIFYLDESARFNIIDGKFEDGFRIVKKMNDMNGNEQLAVNSENGDIADEIKAHLRNWSVDVNKSLH